MDMMTDKWGKRVPFEWGLSGQQGIPEKLVGVRQQDECELLRSKETDRKLVRKFVDELGMRIGLGAFAALQHYVEYPLVLSLGNLERQRLFHQPDNWEETFENHNNFNYNCTHVFFRSG